MLNQIIDLLLELIAFLTPFWPIWLFGILVWVTIFYISYGDHAK